MRSRIWSRILTVPRREPRRPRTQSLTTEHGVTVFISSHILAEVTHLADRIGIVDAGCLIEELDREELHARERGHVRVGASEPQRAAVFLAAAGFAHVEPADGHLRVFDAQDRVPEIARVLVGAGIALTELAPAREDLESYFLRLTGGVK